MNNQTLSITLLILSGIGIGITAYLALSASFSASIACPLNTNCDAVLASTYSSILGIPLAFFGLAYYITLFAVSISYFKTRTSRTLNKLNTFLTLGLSFYLFLFYIQAFVLRAFCIYCLASAIVTIALFIITIRYFQKAKLIGAVILISVAVLYFSNPTNTADANVEAFAQCLTQKGIAMYGADWCPHCQNEKRAFGSAFKHVDYVECPQNQQLCAEKGVTGYPTWLFSDGTRLVGEQGLTRLSQASGCSLNAQ